VEQYGKRGVWKSRRRPVELVQRAALQAHVRSGAENPCHVLVLTWRENLARNYVQEFGECCCAVMCSTCLLHCLH
jgi:hypothetical protein